jgi:excisionase family DNA binding protein
VVFLCHLTDAPSLWRVFIITKYLTGSKIFSQMNIDLTELISVPDAAKMRGVSTQAIHHLIKRGRLNAIEVAGRRVLFRKEVEAFEPLPVGRPRKNSAAKSPQASKAAKRGRASTTKSAKKKKVVMKK